MNNFVRAVADLIALTGALIPVVVALGAVLWGTSPVVAAAQTLTSTDRPDR